MLLLHLCIFLFFYVYLFVYQYYINNILFIFDIFTPFLTLNLKITPQKPGPLFCFRLPIILPINAHNIMANYQLQLFYSRICNLANCNTILFSLESVA